MSTTKGKMSQQDTHSSSPDEDTISPSQQIYPCGTPPLGAAHESAILLYTFTVKICCIRGTKQVDVRV